VKLLVIGATGLVGRELVEQAAGRADVSRVTALVRRDPGARPSPKVLYRVVDFDHLGDGLEDAFAVDTVLCALGTTARATPDPARYRQVEVEIPLAVARRARAAGATRFGLVSSVGASPTSRGTYLRQKGELEVALEQLGWERLVIARPSFLVGKRDEFRLGERVGMLVGRLFPAAYRPVHARQVAAGLLAAVRRGGPAVEVLDNVTLRTGLG
jgi:uncharacterized protein YbjT (DUF2867 family)